MVCENSPSASREALGQPRHEGHESGPNAYAPRTRHLERACACALEGVCVGNACAPEGVCVGNACAPEGVCMTSVILLV